MGHGAGHKSQWGKDERVGGNVKIEGRTMSEIGEKFGGKVIALVR